MATAVTSVSAAAAAAARVLVEAKSNGGVELRPYEGSTRILEVTAPVDRLLVLDR
jgi:hypothetical protein